MKLNRYPLFAAVAALSLTVLTGAVALAQPPAGKGQKGEKGQPGQRRQSLNPKALAKALDLTPEQQDKLKPAFEKFTKARKELQADTATPQKEKREKMTANTKTLMEAVEAVLTDDQKKKFEELKKKAAEAAKKGKKNDGGN